MRNDRENEIVRVSFEFALEIIEYCELLEEKRKYSIARQLLKSGTSIGANIREAQDAESRADFVHKLKIASKEVNETQYWILLCKHSKNYPDPSVLEEKLESIVKLLAKILGTIKRNSIIRKN